MRRRTHGPNVNYDAAAGLEDEVEVVNGGGGFWVSFAESECFWVTVILIS